jgi:predicted metal-dependent hydrolase
MNRSSSAQHAPISNGGTVMHDDLVLPVNASSTPIDILPRKVEFDYSNTPLHWIPGDPFTSHVLNVLHITLPAGEFWFCRVYNKALPLVTDDKLREDVQAFLRQESMHARAHDAALKHYLPARGIQTQTFTDHMDWFFRELLGEKVFGLVQAKPGGWLERSWLKFRLGVIAAIEHFTGVLGSYALNNHTWDNADPVMLDTLRWHGAEEVEHRCVAYDLYQHAGGGYFHRFGLIALVAPLLIYYLLSGAAFMMSQDPALQMKKPSIWRPWFWREWKRIAVQTGHLPRIGWLFSQGMRYLRPGYHPVYEADTQQALDYLRYSPGVRPAGALSAQAFEVGRVEVGVVERGVEVDDLGLVGHGGGEITLALQVIDDLGQRAHGRDERCREQVAFLHFP